MIKKGANGSLFALWGGRFVRRRFCRKENLVYVVGVDVLGDPCDQRDRRAVGVEKESVFVGETIGLPQAINDRPYEGKWILCEDGSVGWKNSFCVVGEGLAPPA